MFIVGGVLFVIGIVMVIRPDLFWMITESWKFNQETEPSSLYLFSTRFGGIVFMIIAVIGIGVAFI